MGSQPFKSVDHPSEVRPTGRLHLKSRRYEYMHRVALHFAERLF